MKEERRDRGSIVNEEMERKVEINERMEKRKNIIIAIIEVEEGKEGRQWKN